MMKFIYNYNNSIKNKLIINIILIHAILMGLIVFDMLEREKNFMQEQIINKGKDFTSILASSSKVILLNNDIVALNELVKNSNDISDLTFAFIINRYGKIQASTDKIYFNTELNDQISQNLLKELKNSKKETYQIAHDGLIDTITRIEIDNHTIGYARTIISILAVTSELKAITTNGIIYIFLAIVLGGLFAWLTVRGMTKNLNIMSSAANEIANRNFDISIPHVKGNDEIAKMSKAFSMMIKSIHAYIKEKQHTEDKITWQANHDSLTKLKNRNSFEIILSNTTKRASRKNEVHTLLFLDLDKFKTINDTVGHLAGDELLIEASKILAKNVRDGDFVSRFGGDEFGIILFDCSEKQAEEIATKLINALGEFDFIWNDYIFKIGASIGICEINSNATNDRNILSNADLACYVAKEKGRNRYHISSNDDIGHLDKGDDLKIIQNINKSLENKNFIVYVQKIESLKNKDNHYEALIRLLDENKHVLSPDKFLPQAEKYFLMTKIDTYMVESVFTWIYKNKSKIDDNIKFSINLSGQTLGSPDFLEFVINLAKELKIDPSKIIFEITENDTIGNIVKANSFLAKLKDFGFSFSLDDFGTGLSSFEYLKNLPISYLKIDGVFIQDILKDEIDRTLVESICKIAYTMNIEVVAEYVENKDILKEIKLIGLDYAQGYGISKPHPIDKLLNI